VVASLVMEQAATTLGTQAQVPDIIIGGVVLAATTSLPNAVAAVYLAVRGRGAATLSEAFNSNAINVLIGFLLPSAIAGVGVFSGEEQFVTWSYLGLTALAITLAWIGRGLSRRSGFVIIAGYAVFAAALAMR
jgi:Ca2+/Na+ antiporter